jgi:O-antigen/teichoic acid export membrane protein
METRSESVSEAIKVAPVRAQADVAKLATGASVSLLGKVGGRGIYVLGQIVIARLLGPEAFGLYAIGWSILRILQATTSLGLHNGVIRFGSRHYHDDPASLKGVVLQSLGWGLAASVLAGIAVFLAAPWLEGLFGAPGLASVVQGFSVAIPLATGLKVAAAATRISQRMQYSVFAEDLAQPAISLTLAVTLFLLGWRLAGAVAADVTSFGVAFVLILFLLKRTFPVVFSAQVQSRFYTQEILLFSLPTTLVGVFPLLTTWADRLFIGYFRPSADVGVYQALAQISIMFTIILRALNLTFAPLIADLYHRREMDRLEVLFRISTKWALYLSIPIFLVICVAPQELLYVIFGAEYAGGSLPLVILAIGQLINVGTGAVGTLLIMTGRQNRWLVFSAAALLASGTLHLMLIPRLGLSGAALSTSISISGLYLGGLFDVRRSLRLWPYGRWGLKLLLAAAPTGIVLLFLRWLGPASPFLLLLFMSLASLGLFGGMLLLMGLDDEDQEFINLMRARIRRPRRLA